MKHTDKLGTEKISKLLLKMSAPAMIGMFVSAFYNLVDTIFVGRGVGMLGIAGVSVSFPIQMIILAIAISIGIGGSSLISRSLGAGDKDRAEKTMGNLFTLIIFSSLAMAVFGLIFVEPLLKIFGANPEIMPFALDYIKIILLGSVFFAFTVASNNVIRAEGNAKTAMSVMLVSAIINIILDPILIIYLDWGIKGAAWATVISQLVAFIYIVYYFISKNSALRLHLKNLKLEMSIVKETLAIGVSTFARQASMSIMAIIINNTLNLYGGSIAIASFGIINRLFIFTLMPLFGVIQGMQPIVGYNYGAKNFDRARQVTILSIKVTTFFSTIAFVFMMLLARPIISLFTKDSELINLSVYATRIIILFLPTLGFQIVAAGLYQALGNAKVSMFLSLLRQVILFVPLLLILPIFFHINGVWFTFPIADSIAGIIIFLMLRREMRLLKN